MLKQRDNIKMKIFTEDRGWNVIIYTYSEYCDVFIDQ